MSSRGRVATPVSMAALATAEAMTPDRRGHGLQPLAEPELDIGVGGLCGILGRESTPERQAMAAAVGVGQFDLDNDRVDVAGQPEHAGRNFTYIPARSRCHRHRGLKIRRPRRIAKPALFQQADAQGIGDRYAAWGLGLGG